MTPRIPDRFPDVPDESLLPQSSPPLPAVPRPQAPASRNAPAAGLVQVRLMHRERAVPGARVTAVRNLGVALLEERIVAVAAADGGARLRLAPGSWYLSATAEEPAIFGWYGSNPVQVRAGETIEVTIPAVPAVAAGSAAPRRRPLSP